MVPVLHVRDFGTMEGTQEALSGKMRLLFTPAARTSLLMLRLNEAALRALQECQQQQVRLAPGPFFPSQPTRPWPPKAMLEKGLGVVRVFRFQSPRLQVKPARQVSPASSILGTLLPLCSAGVWALPAGTASDRFPRPPRGKCWPDVRGRLGVRERKRGLQEGELWAGACQRSQSEQVMRTKPYEDVGLWSQETVQSQPLGGTLNQLHLVC